MTDLPMGFAKNLAFQGPSGETIRLHVADLVSIEHTGAEVVSFFDPTTPPWVIGEAKTVATLTLHPRPDGTLYEFVAPSSPEPTPIYDLLARERSK